MSTKHEGDAGLSSPFAPHPGGSVQIHMRRPTGYTTGADHMAALRHARKLAVGAAENAAWIAAHGGLARCRLHRHRDAATHASALHHRDARKQADSLADTYGAVAEALRDSARLARLNLPEIDE